MGMELSLHTDTTNTKHPKEDIMNTHRNRTHYDETL